MERTELRNEKEEVL